ncbi:MAG: hypothetical protein WCG01_04425 [bacterium]
MTTRRNLVITHGEDVDGIISAALLKRYLDGAEIFLVQHKNQDIFFENLVEDFKLCQNANIYVADLPIKDSYMIDKGHGSVIRRLMDFSNSLTWFDHHVTNDLQEVWRCGCLPIMGTREQKCSASLIYDAHAGAVDVHGNYLAEIAQLNDYECKNGGKDLIEQGITLQRLITYFSVTSNEIGLHSLVESLAVSFDWQSEMQDIFEFSKVRFQAAVRAIANNYTMFQVDNRVVLLALLDPILPQKEIMRSIRENFGVATDVCVGIIPEPVNNVILFKGSRGNIFPVQAFCEFLKGGGRDGDGGFTLPQSHDWSSIVQAMISFKALYYEYLISVI